MMPYWVEPHEVIAKIGNMITAASTNGSVTRNISLFKSIDDLVKQSGSHSLSHEQPHAGYEEVPVPDPPQQYHVVDSPVWPVAVNAQVVVPESTADLPDSEYRVNPSVNLPVARHPPPDLNLGPNAPDPNLGPNTSDVWHLHRFLQDEHPIASETLSGISRMTISKWIYQSYHHCAMQI